MTPTRGLITIAFAVALVPPLGACGEGGFGDFISGSGSANTASPTPTAGSPSTGEALGTPSPATPSGSGAETGMSPSPDEPTVEPSMSPGSVSPGSTATGSPTSTGSVAPTTAAPTGSQGGAVQVDGRTIQGVPDGLAFPSGSKVEGTNAFEGGGGSVVLSAPAEDTVFAYYRSTLPGAGYRVVSDTDGLLAFTGQGFRGTVVGTGTGAVLTWSPAKD